MNEQQIQLSPNAFSLTPGGEVVIDNQQLASVLRESQTSTEGLTMGYEISITIKITK